MSGGTIRIRLETGETYDMPEDVAFPAMRELDQAGTKFTADDAPSVKGNAAPPDPSEARGGGMVYSEPDPSIPPQPNPDDAALTEHANTPEFKNEEAHVLRMLTDPGYFAKQLGSTATRAVTTAIGSAGGIVAPAAAGAAQSYIDDPQHSVYSALIGGGLAAAPGAIAEGFGALGQKLLPSKVAARIKSWNVDDETLKDLAKRDNTTTEQAAADLVKRGEEMVPPNVLAPRGAAGWRNGFEGAETAQGRAVDANLLQAQAEGAKLPKDPRMNLAARVYGKSDQHVAGGMVAEQELADAIANEAAAVQKGPQFESPVDVRRQKTKFDKTAFKGAPGTPEGTKGKAALEAANAYRDLLGEYVAQATPATQAGYNNASANYGAATTLAGTTGDAAAKQVSAGSALGNVAAGAVGAGVGAVFGHPGLGFALGAGSGPAYAAFKNARPLSQDLGANLAGLPTRLSGGFDTLSKGAAPLAAAAAPSATEQLRQYADDSRGYLQPDAVKMLLERNPDALGKYAQPLQAAQQNGTLDAELVKLQFKDPEWRARVLPQIQGLTIDPG